MKLIILNAGLMLALPILGWAATDDEPEGWGGEAELGIVSTSGNTDTRSINAKGKLLYLAVPWRSELKLEALQTSDSGTTTAERYLVAGKSDYRFTANDYWFLSFRYEDDRFSGYDYQYSETVGYGRRVVGRETLKLDLEAGVGGRHSQETAGMRKDEAIVRGAGKLRWQISPTARFTEDLLLESGASNTYTESVSAIKLKVNGNFSMKFSFTVKHNSTVPVGSKHTDTLSAVTLVYDF